MNTAWNSNEVLGRQSLAYSDRSLRQPHGAALVRIFRGPPWAADATLKWLPSFIHGQPGTRDLIPATVPTPVIHQWLELLHSASAPDPAAMAVARPVALLRHVSD